MKPAAAIAHIKQWLKQRGVDAAMVPEQLEIHKAGVIPVFGTGADTEILLVKPQAKKKHLGNPEWQLLKGTRMRYSPAHGWEDIRDAASPDSLSKLTVEPLLVTALREGMEECGLRLDNVASVAPLGRFEYRSLSKGNPIVTYLFAVHVRERDAFSWPDANHPVTQQASWFLLHDLPGDFRPDMLEIVAHCTPTLTGAEQ